MEIVQIHVPSLYAKRSLVVVVRVLDQIVCNYEIFQLFKQIVFFLNEFFEM